MSAVSLRSAFARYWWLGVSVFAVCAILGGLLAFLQPERFSATASLIVSPSKQLGSNIQGLRFVLPSLAEQVDSAENSLAARADLPEALRDAEWDVTVSTDDETLVLEVTAESDSRDVVVPVANSFSREVVRSYDGDPLVAFSVLSPAETPSSNASARAVLLLSGVALGVVLGVLAVVSAQFLRPSVVRAADLKSRGYRVLGVIPRTASGLPNRALATGDPPTDAFERLAITVESVLVGSEQRGAAVLGIGASDGSAGVAANLAWTIGTIGRRVCVIDADLGQPRIHFLMGIVNGDGLSEGADPLPVPDGPQSLSMISSGQTDSSPLEVINARVPEALSRLADEDAWALVSSPPLDSTVQSIMAARLTGAAILVVRAGEHSPSAVDESVSELEAAGVEVFGVVITGAKVSRARPRRDRSREDPVAPAPKSSTRGTPPEGGRPSSRLSA